MENTSLPVHLQSVSDNLQWDRWFRNIEKIEVERRV